MVPRMMMHSIVSAGLLPPTRPMVRDRLLEVATLIGGPLVRPAADHQAMTACVLLPQAGLLLVGTACRAPLLRPESFVVGKLMELTVLLLRFDAERGISLDIKLADRSDWLCNYTVQGGRNGLSLIPPREGQPLLRLSGDGLAEERPQVFNASILQRSEGVNQ